MIYKRTFRISASHFNSQETYDAVWFAVEPERTTVTMPRDTFAAILKDSHGHNFRIDVEIGPTFPYDFDPKDGWLVDDVALAKIVNEWDNVNISMHSDFLDRKLRATTENMAHVLREKLSQSIECTDNVINVVRIHETDDIYAEA